MTLELNTTAFTCSDVGAPVPVTLTVTDGANLTAECTVDVTVVDPTDNCVANQPPTIDCQPVQLSADATCVGTADAAIAAFRALADDPESAPGDLTVSISPTGPYALGETAVTVTVTDPDGAQAEPCVTTITVLDDTAPTAVCQNITVNLETSGVYSLDPTELDGGSTDNCGVAGFGINTTVFDCDDVGETFAIELIVSDNTGNFALCTANVTVWDGNAPTVTCVASPIVLTDRNNDPGACSYTAQGTEFDATANDNCDVTSLTNNFNNAGTLAGATFPVGTTQLRWTALDATGNLDTCSIKIRVLDNTPPTALCQNLTVQLDATGNASILASDINGGSTANNCSSQPVPGGGLDFSASMTEFDCDDVGNTYDITLTVTALSSGLSDACIASVTVEDLNSFCCAPPMAICENITVQLDANGSASITPAGIGSSSTAECGLASESLDKMGFDCADVGGNTVTYTITDVNDDSDNCTATVTVEDKVVPIALCQSTTVQLDANGQGSITTGGIDNGSNDACGIASLSLDNTDFTCSEVGSGNTVTLTVRDNNGNPSTCTAIVTVEDNIAPSAVCLNTTVELQPDGMYELQQSDVYDSINSNDNCSIATVNFPPATFTCDDADQAFNITVTMEDPSGNTDNCTATVSVQLGSSLPPEWSTSDIGDPGNGSDYTYDPCAASNPDQGDVTISTGGYNLIPQNSDNLAFAAVPLCGNGGIQARIESVSGGYAGLMIRESSAPGAKMVAIYSNSTNLLRHETRTVTNGTRSSSTLFAAFPKWLRLVRQGDYIRAFYRNSNAGSWILFHQAYVPMGNCVEMGLAVFTTNPNGDATAVFGRVNYQSQGGQNLSAPNSIVWEAETPEVIKASVLPNPVRNHFTLQFSKPLPAKGQATLLNEFGQRLSQQPLRAGEWELDWDAGALPAGLYFLEVLTEDGYREVLKVVRQ